MLSHGWNDTTQGYKRNYGAFFDVFQYHHTAQEGELRLIDRLYHQRSTARGRYVSLAGIFTYDSTGEVVGEQGSYVSFLFDLVKYSWSEKGSRWRIFYIPL
jgi:flagellar basal body rod protein FlgG